MKNLCIVIAVLVFVPGFAFAAGGQEREPAVTEEFGTPNQVINLTAAGFEFFIDGQEQSNPDIVVQQGDIVEVTLTVTGGTHDWVVDEFNVSTKLISSGQTSTVVFIADQNGEFEYYCSFGNHRQMGMYGRLIVE